MSSIMVTKQHVIDVFIFFVIFIPLTVLNIWGQPVQTGFWCRDQSLRYSYKPDTVSTPMLLIVSLGGSFLVMAVVETVRAAATTRLPRRFKSELFSLAKAYGTFLFGLVVNCLCTDLLKLSVARHRPHFIDVCKPNFDTINCTSDGLGMDRFVMDYECTNNKVDPKLLRDARCSFPSGHAALSFYSALFTIFYLQLRMNVKFSHLLRPTLQLIVLALAVLCSVSRLFDHKHFAADIIAGAALGGSIAWLSFYKVADKLIPTTTVAGDNNNKKAAFARATSIESEPQTPTPLLRPERLVLSNGGNTIEFITNDKMLKRGTYSKAPTVMSSTPDYCSNDVNAIH